MRKEVSVPMMAGIIAIVVILVAVAGYFALRSPAASGTLTKAEVKATNDPINDGKMGPKSLKGKPLPAGDSSQKSGAFNTGNTANTGG